MENIFDIVEQVFGEDIEVTNLVPFENSLPLFYRKNFKVYKVEGSFEFILIVPIDEQLEKELLVGAARYIKKTINKITFIYLKDCSFKNKSIFMQENINFISSDSDHFLVANNNYVNIHDSSECIYKNSYTKKTQLIAQFYLTHEVRPYTVREIANILGFSPSSVSRANSFFLEHGAIDKIGVSSSADYVIRSKKEFFTSIKEYIINPAKRRISVLLNANEKRIKALNLFKCGETALEEYTNLQKANTGIQYAVDSNDFNLFQRSYKDWLVNSLDMSLYTIYEFIYDPSIFGSNGLISAFDTYAMLYDFYKNSNNSRVQDSLESLERIIVDERN